MTGLVWSILLAVLTGVPLNPSIGKEIEYEPGKYLTVLARTDGWTVWRREDSGHNECVAARPADGKRQLQFRDGGWVQGGLKVYIWVSRRGEEWGVDDGRGHAVMAEWRILGERYMSPFPMKLFPREGDLLYKIDGPSPFKSQQQIEVMTRSRYDGHVEQGRFTLLGLDEVREILLRCSDEPADG